MGTCSGSSYGSGNGSSNRSDSGTQFALYASLAAAAAIGSSGASIRSQGEDFDVESVRAAELMLQRAAEQAETGAHGSLRIGGASLSPDGAFVAERSELFSAAVATAKRTASERQSAEAARLMR